MNTMPMDMDRQFMHNKFWLDGQISFTFAPQRDDPIGNLHLEDLELFLKAHGFVLQDTSRPSAMADDKQKGTPDIYIFPSPITGPFDTQTVQVIGFFPLSTLPPSGTGAMGSASTMMSMPGMNSAPADETGSEHQQQAGNEPKPTSTPGPIPTLVNLINNPDTLKMLRAGGSTVTVDGVEKKLNAIPITSAAPNWLCGATHTDAPISQGCPLSPPIPVPADATCLDSSGLWPITLPDLPADLKPMTGDGVTVFVLDTLPKREQITRAAEVAEEHNMLLLDLDSNESSIKFYYPPLADQLDLPSPARAETGKDINGKSIGFRMPDHGLFVAGIIHDIAPNATIECIRILNDFCVGSVQQIIDTLNKTLLPRLSVGGNLYGKPVVINMSLVIPDNFESLNAGIANQSVLDTARTGLLTAISSIIDVGATFVASAGNEGDQRYKPMTTTHPEALYPAAFAYDGLPAPSASHMIPVGAVDKDGHVTEYSCYPGVHGVATYGGNLPAKEDIYQDSGGMTRLKNIDGVIGVYTQLSYPALAYEDPEPTYAAPNGHGWAYWVGTSFATPIVSAAVARTLELKMRNPQSPRVLVPGTLANAAATGQVMWTNLTPATTPASSATHGGSPATELPGAIIKAVQCKPSHSHMHHAHEQEVEVNLTEVNITEMPVLVVEEGQQGVLED